ncbi:MAG: nucleotidyl transferase AbiEii/AbiGii toxin family protein [Pirellulaceae bacterium]
MDDVARFTAGDRRDLFTETAARRRSLGPAIVEKDFWVCWTLRRCFGLDDPPASLIFKGGTSLSKVYGLIDRFSEDVDLSFNRSDLGFAGEQDPATAPSRKQARLRVEELADVCRSVLSDDFMPKLSEAFSKELGERDWKLELDPDDPDGQTLLFEYPPGVEGQEEPYVHPVVRLEFGARSDHWPAEAGSVTPYAAEVFGDQFQDAETEVLVLAAERTFWEKATILHAWHHAPAEKTFRDRQSRHYYDVVMLWHSDVRTKAMEQIELLEAVAKHKNVFFASAWAKYDEARRGTLRLLPPEHLRMRLKEDYERMQEMFFEEPPGFDSLLERLAEIEAVVNEKS